MKHNEKTGGTGLTVLLSCCVLTLLLLVSMLTMGSTSQAQSTADTDIQGIYQQNLTNEVSKVLDGLVAIQRTYTLRDSDIVAPEPDPDAFGQAETPAQMQEILDRAAVLLDGQETLFTAETSIKEGSVIHYYFDETILAITWKQVVDDCTYTFCEVKIAHASQIRRFLSEGKYNSGIQHTTTEMSEAVNAVAASSGDYYGYREIGIVVNDGLVYRDRGHFLDTCYIDGNGDLLFTYAGDFTEKEAIQAFVDENNVRFSLCFGPVMIRNGEYCVPARYNSGEINNPYARAALCQLGELHYAVVAANAEEPNYSMPTVAQFGRRLHEMGIQTAYALDGGQTAAIVMNDQLINTVSYGSQREISDIFYFATALPEAGKE